MFRDSKLVTFFNSMQQECLNKVKEKFKVLRPEEIASKHEYITQDGTFCFNAHVLNICVGLDPAKIGNQYINVPTRMEEELGIQSATIQLINDVHEKFIYNKIDFEESIEEVLAILGNDGNNIMPTAYEPEWDDEPEYDDQYDPSNND